MMFIIVLVVLSSMLTDLHRCQDYPRLEKPLDIISMIEHKASIKITRNELTQIQNNSNIAISANSFATLKKVSEWKCSVCVAAGEVISKLLKVSSLDSAAVDFIKETCITLKIQSERVCDMVVEEWRDPFVYLVSNGIMDPSDACSEIFTNDCGGSYETAATWNISLNATRPPYKIPRNVSKNSPKLRVLHFSDLHLDDLYQAGRNADCGEPLCCRESDAEATGSHEAGWFADNRNCDISGSSLKFVMNELSKEKFDIILFTGDIPPHDVYNQTTYDQLHYIDYAYKVFRESFPSTPLLPVVGNHESAPVNLFPPPFSDESHSSHPMAWLYDNLATHWSHWLPQEVMSTVKKGGYWAWSIFKGLRIIAINTSYGDVNNWYLFYKTHDPADQMQWLADQLNEAELAGEKVWIIGHIYKEFFPGYWTWYSKIIKRYSGTIANLFFGHTHYDEFQVFLDRSLNNTPVMVNFICPSITQMDKLNIGYRVYEVDGIHAKSTFAVLDHRTYIINVTDANLRHKPHIEKEYTAKEYYKMKGFFPSDWKAVADKILKNETAAIDYQFFKYKSARQPMLECDASCRKDIYDSLIMEI